MFHNEQKNRWCGLGCACSPASGHYALTILQEGKHAAAIQTRAVFRDRTIQKGIAPQYLRIIRSICLYVTLNYRSHPLTTKMPGVTWF